MTLISASVMHDLAPDGVLKAAINLGNPVLVQHDEHSGQYKGISFELAKALATELNVRLEPVIFDAAGKVFSALQEDRWRVAFLAIEPVREAELAFSEPYVVIEGTYLVRDDSPYLNAKDLDRSDVTIAVGKGAAYDLFLSRTLKHARLERASTSAGAVDLFLESRLQAAAGVRQPLEEAALTNSGLRVLSDSFTAIQQAMAVPKQFAAGAEFVRDFLVRQKTEGFITAALTRNGQDAQLAASVSSISSRPHALL